MPIYRIDELCKVESMINIDLVFFDAGGGHRAAAEALRVVMEEEGGWQIRLVNLQELMDPIDVVRKLTGVRMQDLYNLMLKKGWTLGTPQTLRVLQFLIRLLHPQAVRLIRRILALQPPRPGGFGGSPFQPSPRPEPAPGTARGAVCYPPDRHCGLSPPLLDRASRSVPHLRLGPVRGAGARHEHLRRADLSSLGHDPASAFLPAHPVRPARGTEAART